MEVKASCILSCISKTTTWTCIHIPVEWVQNQLNTCIFNAKKEHLDLSENAVKNMISKKRDRSFMGKRYSNA